MLLERWQGGDYAVSSAISYPESLLDSVQSEFARIKLEQATMLGGSPQEAVKTLLEKMAEVR